MAKKILIIVDMLNDFIHPQGVLFCGKTAATIVPYIQKQLAQYRRQNDLIVFLKDSHDEDDKEFERYPKHCVSGTWGSQIIPELTPETGEWVIAKKRFSGFFGTELAQVLQGAGANEVEVAGVCTSICVMDTVGGLANRDYHIRVPIKGVADFDAEFHQFALKRMVQTYGAEVF